MTLPVLVLSCQPTGDLRLVKTLPLLILTVFRLKTGCVPPPDLQFEEYLPGVLVDLKQLPTKRNSLIRVRSKQSLCKGGNVNYYQMKRDLEKKIDSQESELLRGEYYWFLRTFHELC